MRRVRFVRETQDRLARFWFNFALGTKIAVIVVIGTIALVGLFAYLGTAALSESTQRTMDERVILGKTIARHIDYVISNIEDALTDTASQSVWQDRDRSAPALESAYRRLDFFATRVFLLDTNAHLVAAYPPITSPVSFDNFSIVTAVLNGQPVGVSPYRRSVDSLDAMTIAAAPTRNQNSQINGALAASIDLTKPEIGAFTQPIGLGESGYIDLIDLNGTILASTRRDRIGIESDHGQTLAGTIREHREVVSACHNCHEAEVQAPQREVLAFAPLYRAQWGVTVRQSEDEVFSVTRQLQARIFALMVVMFAGALVLVYLTTRSVIVPVQTLTEASKRIASGDLTTPIPLFGRDEIGTLAHSFDAMRVRLNESINEIQEWNRELESRVQEGTAACRSALEENQHLYSELKHRDQMRGDLLHRLITAQEEERKRISRELHDETYQILTGLEYALDNAAETGTLEEIPPLLERMHSMTENALQGVQRMMFDLRPAMLDHLGLIPALRWYAETRLKESGTQVRIRELGELLRLSPDVETALYRVVEEAINNIARHSRARSAELVFEFTNDRVEIRVSDDGSGFDLASLKVAPDGKRGLGLMGMEERMGVINGEFHLESNLGSGTVIHLIVPIREGEHGKNTSTDS